jgi:hypothetical protein
MKLSVSKIVLVVLFLGGHLASGAPAEPAENLAQSTLERFSSALATGDAGILSELSSPRFRMVEDGVEYDLGATVSSTKAALRSAVVTRSTRDFHIRRQGDVAWAVYRVDGHFKSSDASGDFHRIETAVLLRQGDNWRIEILTSSSLAEHNDGAKE